MASESNQQQDSWNEGLSTLMDATRQQMTATRMAAAGMVAIGAAATAYFWDPQRRSRFMETTQRYSEDLFSWWNTSSGQKEGGSGGKAQGNRA